MAVDLLHWWSSAFDFGGSLAASRPHLISRPQISFDVFPEGWDKTYCLKHVTQYSSFREIHFFGDKTYEGGNDYEIFNSPSVIGHTVTNWQDTKYAGEVWAPSRRCS